MPAARAHGSAGLPSRDPGRSEIPSGNRYTRHDPVRIRVRIDRGVATSAPSAIRVHERAVPHGEVHLQQHRCPRLQWRPGPRVPYPFRILLSRVASGIPDAATKMGAKAPQGSCTLSTHDGCSRDFGQRPAGAKTRVITGQIDLGDCPVYRTRLLSGRSQVRFLPGVPAPKTPQNTGLFTPKDRPPFSISDGWFCAPQTGGCHVPQTVARGRQR
jgi:hypothetical protein